MSVSDRISFVSDRALFSPSCANSETIEEGSFLKAAVAQGFLCHEYGCNTGEFDWNYKNVISPFWRLYYNFKSGNSIRGEGRMYPLDPARLLLVPPFYTFDCQGPRTAPHFWLHFSFPSHVLFGAEEPLMVSANPVIRLLLEKLRQAFSRGKETADSLGHLCQALLHLTFQRLPMERRKQLPPQLHDLVLFIEESLGERMSNAFLARRTGRSVSSFIRWFREYLNSSPAEYVKSVRLASAARLLACTDQSIEQITDRCGFPNRHYFSRLFTRQYQQGPATFRKNSRKSLASVV
jgi:AraC family transcriptional regulator, arabinose operon regulatory protein